jgi:hypothetical protein
VELSWPAETLGTRPGDSQQGEVPPEGKAMTQNASSLPEQEGLIPLPIPVPPSLAGALGYGGEEQFLALWWETAADEAMWSDGRTTTNAWRHGFLAYIQHPRVKSYLAPYDLGSSEEPAVHYLLLDLVDHQAYIGTASQVTRFLRNYTPGSDLSAEQVAMLSQLRREQPLNVDHDAVERELEFRSLAVQATLEELESHF